MLGHSVERSRITGCPGDDEDHSPQICPRAVTQQVLRLQQIACTLGPLESWQPCSVPWQQGQA